MGYQDLSVTRARTRHMIVMTDGQSPTEGISDLVQTAASEGITISTVGLGPQVDRALLEGIAESGGGRSYFTNDPYNIPRIFTKETSQVARSAVVEEWFQAHQVAPAQFLRGIDIAGAPYLEGYVATKAKAEPAEVILASDYGEPILARWRVGLGWSMAWTSDVKNRWSVHWVAWPGFGKFWGQLVREHMRQRRRTLYDMRTEVADGRVHAIVDAIGEDDRFINDLDSTLTIAAADGGTRSPWTRTEPMRQTAPGRYEADFPLDRYGSFALRAVHKVDERVVAESFAQLANPYPREYLATGPNAAVLVELARATRGRMDPTPAQTFDAFGEKLTFHQELWPTLVGAALALFLLDLIFRRVRIFDRKFKRSP
jgi:Ca-activated chloride channel homolog